MNGVRVIDPNIDVPKAIANLAIRLGKLEEWKAETNEHLGATNYLVGTLKEGVERLEKLVNKVRYAGVEEVAEAMQEVSKLKVMVAGLDMLVKDLDRRVPPDDRPCHSFFSED